MEKRNPYADGVNFSTLALQSSAFSKFLKPNGQVDFSDPQAVQELTKSLLKRDFSLEIALPDDRLCPPVPNRLNYILWLQDLLDTSGENYNDRYDVNRDVVGLDVGTGASCIYPLLGCTQRSKWTFIGTDIDEKSLQFAQDNIAANNLKSRIKLVKTTRDYPLIDLEKFELESIDFVMCNPPFYESREEMLSSAAKKQRHPFSACTGAEVEMVTSGGEVAFVVRLIDESVALQDRVEWYTTMLGKYSSVSVIVERLKRLKVHNWAVTEFSQGNKTRRWAVAWTWSDMRPRMHVARGISTLPKHLLPFPSEFHLEVGSKDSQAIGQFINGILEAQPLQWQWRPGIATGVGFARENVWSRASRRRKTPHKDTDASMHDTETSDEDEEEPALGFRIDVREITESGHTGVTIRWLKGKDSVLFESFCGMLKRKVETTIYGT